MANQSLRNKNPHKETTQLFAHWENTEPNDSQSFQVFPHESVADKDKETGPG